MGSVVHFQIFVGLVYRHRDISVTVLDRLTTHTRHHIWYCFSMDVYEGIPLTHPHMHCLYIQERQPSNSVEEFCKCQCTHLVPPYTVQGWGMHSHYLSFRCCFTHTLVLFICSCAHAPVHTPLLFNVTPSRAVCTLALPVTPKTEVEMEIGTAWLI